ncbi:MAG: adenosine deaminase, partial [Opitutaceae bacterium]|nr:adenosine deaminase [Opitutaceae bacterium]
GAIPDALLREWRPDRYPPNPPFHAADYRYPDFPTFEQVLLDHALPWFISADRYHEAMKAIFATHVAQNVLYVETSFHLPVTQFINVPGPEIIAAIRSAAPPNLEVRVFAGMPRDVYRGAMQAVIDDLENWDELAGVDLHGLETMPTEAWSSPAWARMRAAGKITKCHAGEFDGAARVREAIEILGVARVQHGVRAIEDPEVVALARDRGVTFDVCPISNIRLRVFPDFASHPLRRLSTAGVRCTISTDDPLCFNNRLNDEYRVLADEMNCDRLELAHYVRHGWDVADVSSEFRHRQLAEIDRLMHER